MTIRSKEFDDVYFSAEDGLAETAHVFLQGNDLEPRFTALEQGACFTIAETGFGTGLNLLAAWALFERTAPQDAQLHFISFEKFPLETKQITEALEPWDGQIADYTRAMCEAYSKKGGTFALNDRITLTLHIGDVNDVLPTMGFTADAWFLDGFKPSTNPDMWSEVVFTNMARLSRPGATLATFTAAGFVRRGLQTAGFEVNKVSGFGRKREMITGVMPMEVIS